MGRNKLDKAKIVLILTILYLIIYVLTGLKVGYQRTPYSLKTIEIIKNLFTIVAFSLLIEYIRTKLIKHSKTWLSFICITLILFLLKVQYRKFSSAIPLEDLIEYILVEFLTSFIESILLSYLSKNGGLILYLLIFLFTKYEDTIIIRKSKKQIKRENPAKSIPIVLAILLVVVFVAGFLPYKPVAVISNSMAPHFNRGDVCVIKKITDYTQIRNLKEGDIIEYQLNNIFVLHRIVEIKETTKGHMYSTKWDNNKDTDLLPVYEEQIVGIVTYVVQYLGYPSVWFSEWLNKNK